MWDSLFHYFHRLFQEEDGPSLLQVHSALLVINSDPLCIYLWLFVTGCQRGPYPSFSCYYVLFDLTQLSGYKIERKISISLWRYGIKKIARIFDILFFILPKSSNLQCEFHYSRCSKNWLCENPGLRVKSVLKKPPPPFSL